ncbi:hypothetical protein F4561_000838 [Lipingzhangella halophila]|uniref:Flp pilus assembly pilin Flp n=1 Tax=Lipingzhangella halophila TaxID=1783352 RepID=A0A7W7RDK1_9ACTN|nr:hypothetical protein [Lipingzhangella halophila]MBB4930018.1 hypothetical protein [Lipingzhangella halophila]
MTEKGNTVDRGASLTEYAAVILLVAAISTTVITSDIGTSVTDLIRGALCSVKGEQECSDPTTASEEPDPATDPDPQTHHPPEQPDLPEQPEQPSQPDLPQDVQAQPQVGDGVLDNATYANVVPAAHGGNADESQECEPGGPGTDHDRQDTGRDAASRGDASEGPGLESCGTPAPSEEGLGDPESGESVDVPEPPPFEPVDEGSGEWGSENSKTNVARQTHVRLAAEAGAHAVSGSMPNASRNLLHYLGNSGEPLEQDVEQIFEDVPDFASTVDERNERVITDAVNEAQDAEIDEPTTYPISTPWSGYSIGDGKSSDWYRALGGIMYNITGQVTVYPPDDPDGEYRYEMETTTNIRDTYNWDADKAANVGPFKIEDDTLGALHRAGLAREYLLHGSSDTETREGTVE